MTAVEHLYHYNAPSGLTGGALHLATEATVDGAAGYLRADLCDPVITAKCLRAVSETVAARYYIPPAMLARILREADPVATVSPNAIRFEGFSACCSTYIRLDLDDSALNASHRRNGTTNVDFGAELRAALAIVQPQSKLSLTIGHKAVGFTRDDTSVIERKVPLPVRWLRGFGAVQMHLAGMEPAFSLPTIQAQRFLRGLPRGKTDNLAWLTAQGTRVIATSRQSQGAVALCGGHRLRVLEPLFAMAKTLHVYRNPLQVSSAWVLDFGTQRLTLVLNAQPWRGFSGDGAGLSALALDDRDVAALRAQLHWQTRIDPTVLADVTGLDRERIASGMAQLSAAGLVGFDLAQDAWFHRALPFDMDQIIALNPRIAAAQKLMDRDAVTLTAGGGIVASEGADHRVTISNDGFTCTCPWFAKNQTKRGPCKHVLAVEMRMEK